jgi:predicted DNA-binding transcriptional regulator YafY
MLETSARLLRLLSLLETRRDWSGGELAERLEVDVRTVRRDIDRLRTLGYPVLATPGTGGGYRLGAGAALPPLLLDDDEAVAVAVGLRTAAGGTVEGIEETSVRALVKLEQVLPARLRERVSALQSATVPLWSRGPTVDAGTLAALAGACRDGERLRMDYRLRDGSEGTRRVEPHRLVCTGRRWYLLGWDLDRDDWRTFRVDRIERVLATGLRFPPREPPEEGVAAYVRRGLSAGAYPHRARVRFHASAAEIADRVGWSYGHLEPLDEHSCMLETGADSLDVITAYVLMVGVDFDVLEPPELLDAVRTMADRLARAAG